MFYTRFERSNIVLSHIQVRILYLILMCLWVELCVHCHDIVNPFRTELQFTGNFLSNFGFPGPENAYLKSVHIK